MSLTASVAAVAAASAAALAGALLAAVAVAVAVLPRAGDLRGERLVPPVAGVRPGAGDFSASSVEKVTR